MASKKSKPSYEQILETLRTQGFELSAYASTPGGMLVTKYGAGAVLVAGNAENPVALAIHPGAVVRGEVARLLDRGYQKFIQTSQYELPATAAQLHAIHEFSEELTLYSGGESLYNESLGSTSDLYQYDRLKGRDEHAAAGHRPWELSSGH